MVQNLVMVSLATLLGVITSVIASRIWQLFREFSYRRHETRYAPRDFNIPDIPILRRALSEPLERLRKSATDLLASYHADAVSEQNLYHKSIATSISATLVGFLGLSWSLTVGATSAATVRFCAVLDVACFSLALLSFWHAIRHHERWLKARAKTELLRQWCTVDNVLIPSDQKRDLTSRFLAYASEIDIVLTPRETFP